MAPHGAGPTRKSHTKSRKGCKTCKRRHIRCDENFPQCRNCTKHSCRCDYNDLPPSDDVGRSPQEPNLLWTPKIESEIQAWRQTGMFPFSEMKLQRFPFHDFRIYSTRDLRLIYHISDIYRSFILTGFVNCTLWVEQIPNFLDASVGHNFVMSSILSLSAMHIAKLTHSVETNNLAYYHRGVALTGLREAIGNFSQDNSDAILAASLLLSWQSSDWDDWTSLMQGMSSVIISMDAWKDSSKFASYIDSNPNFFSAQSTQASSINYDENSLMQATDALYRLSIRTPSVHPIAQRVHEIYDFAQHFQACSTAVQSTRLFEELKPLREWLFWMPVSIVKAHDMSSSALILLAQTYSLALAIDFALPELNGAALGHLTASAVEQVDSKLRYRPQPSLAGIDLHPSETEDLMQFARLAVARSRLASTPPVVSQIKLEDAGAQNTGIQTLPLHSPYGHGHHRNLSAYSVGSIPGTPDYPPPSTPGYSSTPPMLPTHSFEDLSHPPSPFLRYDSQSPRHSLLADSPRPQSLTFDSSTLTGYEYSLKGDSPAYSPAAYSPGLVPDSNDEEWTFPEPSPAYSTGGPQQYYTESSQGATSHG